MCRAPLGNIVLVFHTSYSLDSCRVTFALKQRRQISRSVRIHREKTLAMIYLNIQWALPVILDTQLTKTLTIQAETELLTKSINHLAGGDPMDMFEFAFETPWKKRLCHAFTKSVDLSKSNSSTVDKTPCSTDALLLVLTEAIARYCSKQKFWKGANRQGNCIQYLFLFPKIVLRVKIAQMRMTVTIPRSQQAPNQIILK